MDIQAGQVSEKDFSIQMVDPNGDLIKDAAGNPVRVRSVTAYVRRRGDQVAVPGTVACAVRNSNYGFNFQGFVAGTYEMVLVAGGSSGFASEDVNVIGNATNWQVSVS